MQRPSWTDYFMGLAKVVSQRSHDLQTQHGCVITDRNNRILGLGYNGFARGLDDKLLPKTRPDKYSWMIHAERNALSNCIIRPENGIAYVTGQCCNDCIMALWQEGVSKVVMMNSHGTHKFDENAKKIFDTFVNMSKINIVYVDADLSWLRQISGVI
jgi:dCMP deaminase